jgi:hypothetical protein
MQGLLTKSLSNNTFGLVNPWQQWRVGTYWPPAAQRRRSAVGVGGGP